MCLPKDGSTPSFPVGGSPTGVVVGAGVVVVTVVDGAVVVVTAVVVVVETVVSAAAVVPSAVQCNTENHRLPNLQR